MNRLCEVCRGRAEVIAYSKEDQKKNPNPDDPIVLRYYCKDDLPDKYKK